MTQDGFKIRSIPFVSLLCILVLVLAVLTGCEDTDALSAPVATTPFYPQLSPIAPPAPVLEQAPALESPMTELWRPGYWSYDGNNFNWVPGEAMAKPASTAVWFSSYWTKHSYGWAFVPGYWQ